MTMTMEKLRELQAEAETNASNEDAGYPDVGSNEEPDEGDVPELAKKETAEEPEEPAPEPIEEDEDEIKEDSELEPSEFSFDPKIKVMDSEIEVPEFLAKHVTNAEEAKIVKELTEKAYGLDAVKEKRDHYKTQVQEVESRYYEVHNELKKTNENLDFLDNLIQSGDMQTFQQYSGINDDTILKRAAEIIQYRELTPTQKSEYDRNTQSRQRQYALEFENQDLRQNHEGLELRKTQEALDTALSSEETHAVASDFDNRLGYGAFKKEVIQRAMYVEQTTGKSMSPEEAVKETVRVLGLQPSQVKTDPETTQQTNSKINVDQRVVVRDKPTILKVDGGAKSPVKAKVKSIDDLRRLAQQFEH